MYSGNFRLGSITYPSKTKTEAMTSTYLHYNVVARTLIVVQFLWIDHWQLHFCGPVARPRNNIERSVAIIRTVAVQCKVELSVFQLQSVVPSVRVSLTVSATQTEQSTTICPSNTKGWLFWDILASIYAYIHRYIYRYVHTWKLTYM